MYNAMKIATLIQQKGSPFFLNAPLTRTAIHSTTRPFLALYRRNRNTYTLTSTDQILCGITKVGMLMLSHYELESSDDSSLSYPSKHSVSKERFAYWTGQLWRGEKSCKCTIEPPSEQELPYDSQCFVRLYDLANLISIGDEECTEIQNDRSNRINIQVVNGVLG